jgi:hypothetical protein
LGLKTGYCEWEFKMKGVELSEKTRALGGAMLEVVLAVYNWWLGYLPET